MFATFGKAAVSSVFTTTVAGLSSRRWQPMPQEPGNLSDAGHSPHEPPELSQKHSHVVVNKTIAIVVDLVQICHSIQVSETASNNPLLHAPLESVVHRHRSRMPGMVYLFRRMPGNRHSEIHQAGVQLSINWCGSGKKLVGFKSMCLRQRIAPDNQATAVVCRISKVTHLA